MNQLQHQIQQEQQLNLMLRGHDLKSSILLCNSYFIVKSSHVNEIVYQSETVYNDNNPLWNTMSLSMSDLCENDSNRLFRIQILNCVEEEQDFNNDSIIGNVVVSVKQLEKYWRNGMNIQVLDSNGVNSGEIQVQSVMISNHKLFNNNNNNNHNSSIQSDSFIQEEELYPEELEHEDIDEIIHLSFMDYAKQSRDTLDIVQTIVDSIDYSLISESKLDYFVKLIICEIAFHLETNQLQFKLSDQAILELVKLSSQEQQQQQSLIDPNQNEIIQCCDRYSPLVTVSQIELKDNTVDSLQTISLNLTGKHMIGIVEALVCETDVHGKESRKRDYFVIYFDREGNTCIVQTLELSGIKTCITFFPSLSSLLNYLKTSYNPIQLNTGSGSSGSTSVQLVHFYSLTSKEMIVQEDNNNNQTLEATATTIHETINKDEIQQLKERIEQLEKNKSIEEGRIEPYQLLLERLDSIERKGLSKNVDEVDEKDLNNEKLVNQDVLTPEMNIESLKLELEEFKNRKADRHEFTDLIENVRMEHNSSIDELKFRIEGLITQCSYENESTNFTLEQIHFKMNQLTDTTHAHSDRMEQIANSLVQRMDNEQFAIQNALTHMEQLVVEIQQHQGNSESNSLRSIEEWKRISDSDMVQLHNENRELTIRVEELNEKVNEMERNHQEKMEEMQRRNEELIHHFSSIADNMTMKFEEQVKKMQEQMLLQNTHIFQLLSNTINTNNNSNNNTSSSARSKEPDPVMKLESVAENSSTTTDSLLQTDIPYSTPPINKIESLTKELLESADEQLSEFKKQIQLKRTLHSDFNASKTNLRSELLNSSVNNRKHISDSNSRISKKRYPLKSTLDFVYQSPFINRNKSNTSGNLLSPDD